MVRMLLVSALIMGFSATSAWADRIDGEWCHPEDGRHLEIDGSSIITPSGTATEGEYDRHNFSYVSPPSDPDAGTTIAMRQLNDDLMLMTVGGAAEEEWRRCRLQTSQDSTTLQLQVIGMSTKSDNHV